LHPDDQLIFLADPNILFGDVSQHLEKIMRCVDDIEEVWWHVIFGVVGKENYLVIIGFEEEDQNAFVHSDVSLIVIDDCVEFILLHVG